MSLLNLFTRMIYWIAGPDKHLFMISPLVEDITIDHGADFIIVIEFKFRPIREHLILMTVSIQEFNRVILVFTIFNLIISVLTAFFELDLPKIGEITCCVMYLTCVTSITVLVLIQRLLASDASFCSWMSTILCPLMGILDARARF